MAAYDPTAPAAAPPPPPRFGAPEGAPLPGGSPYGGRRPYRRARRLWVFVIGGILAVAAVTLLLLTLYPSWFGVGPPGIRGGSFGGIFLLFFVLIVVSFVVRVAFWTSRAGRYRGGGGGYGPGPGNRPLMVARMRYARGEITREQYEQIVSDLGRRPGPP